MSLLSKEKILSLLEELNEELGKAQINGEVSIYGGAVMCLVYQSRPATKDVDAIFEPTQKIRKIISSIASKHDLMEDWLNDALKGFIVEHKKKIWIDYEYLKVFVPEPDYLLAMKCLASRIDTSDKDDIIFLIQKLQLQTPEEVFSIIEKYYPKERIKPVTQYFIEEIFET